MTGHKLPRDFFARPAPLVARDLIGKIVVRRTPEGETSGRLVEVEAYLGASDPASHAFRGPTRRNAVMFGPPGFLYVYVSYGMHRCANIVTDEAGVAGAVLLRALEPLTGLDIMLRRRGERPVTDLCNGPGKLCAALAIGIPDYGADMQGDAVFVVDDGFTYPLVDTGPRVGISRAQQSPYRFFVPASPFISRGKPSMTHGTGTA